MDIDTGVIYKGDCEKVLKKHFPDECIDLIYLDPPFSFKRPYGQIWYDKETRDMFEDMTRGEVKHFISWLSARIKECHRVLKSTGSLYLHCDWQYGHYIKVAMDEIFEKQNFQNEVVWGYRTGGVSKRRWPRKHDTIFMYSKGSNFTFNAQKERRYYDSPFFTTKTDENGRYYADVYVRDVWEDIKAIINVSKERLGYPTQKPVELLERIVNASSNPGDIVLDPMCGCGTTVAAAQNLDRKWVGIDVGTLACETIKNRMEGLAGVVNVEIRGPSTMDDLRNMKHFDFEDYICGMTNSEKTKHVGDKGIDGYYSDKRIPLQVKQQERVGRKIIDEFETAMRRKRKYQGYIIAFSFTSGAHEEVARAKEDDLNIKLVTVEDLLLNDYALESLED